MSITVSENYFKYDQSDAAKSLRKIYGENGYDNYVKKMNSIMDAETGAEITNPIEASKEKYFQAKKQQYYQALSKSNKMNNIWSQYRSTYASNLQRASRLNNGISLTGKQKVDILNNSGNGATQAYNNFKAAQQEAEFAFSLYRDASI